MTMLPKKIAAINDLAGYGRCSLSVMLPVISVTGNQCCAVPTAILSSTDAIENFFHYDLTNQMESYTQQWKKMNLAFDGIYTGYLNSRKQIDSILDFIQYFKKDNTILFVDPVLGDHGLYGSNYSKELMESYRFLIQQADIITPNLTEAHILCNQTYNEYPNDAQLDLLGKQLLELGSKTVVITGVKREDKILNILFSQSKKDIISAPLCKQERVGTGDLFASIVLSELVNSKPLKNSIQKAANFISDTLSFSLIHNIPIEEGICFEPLLGQLTSELR